MDIGPYALQLFSGLSRAMVLFLLSAGLSLIFGVMNILNFAHATLFLLSGYVTFSIFTFLSQQFGASPWMLLPAIVGAVALMSLVGFALERFLIRHTYERELPEQLLLTFALVLILGDVIKSSGAWRTGASTSACNDRNAGHTGQSVPVRDHRHRCRRGRGLWYFLHRTRFGKIVRAAVQPQHGQRARHPYPDDLRHGIRPGGRLRAACSPLLPMALGIDLDIIVQSFAVVVIGLRQHARHVRRFNHCRRGVFVLDSVLARWRIGDDLPDPDRGPDLAPMGLFGTGSLS